jgi:allantoicase
VFPIWSYECNSGACEEKVDGTGSFDLLSECLDSCIIPIADYSIYPNPSNGIVNITLGNYENSTISIYDLNGKKVKELKTNELNNITLDLSSLKKGAYIVKLSDKEKLVSKQLILD